MPDAVIRPVIAGRYEVLRTLGRGSFGRTFLACDRVEDRSVAVKMLDARRAPDWKAFDLFEREAAVLRSLRHPGIPQIFDSFRGEWVDGEAAFLVMEYVEGRSLEQTIQDSPNLESVVVRRLFIDLLGILEYLHERMPPILHRDIKPANIIVRDTGTPALVDFGAVRNVFAGPDDAGSTVVGTFGYMPYEQYMGQASASSDLYSLAATLLHLVTRRPPREFMNEGGRIEVPSTLPDQRLRAVLARMLQPSPADRFASSRDAADALLSDDAPLATYAVQIPEAASLLDLPAIPRRIEGDVQAIYERLGQSGYRLMMGPEDRPVSFGRFMRVIALTVASLGLMPLAMYGTAAMARRRLRRFLRDGHPAIGRILGIHLEDSDLGGKQARVTYEFEADGRLHRSSELILPHAPIRLHPGETVQVLHLPNRNYDSTIIV